MTVPVNILFSLNPVSQGRTRTVYTQPYCVCYSCVIPGDCRRVLCSFRASLSLSISFFLPSATKICTALYSCLPQEQSQIHKPLSFQLKLPFFTCREAEGCQGSRDYQIWPDKPSQLLPFFRSQQKCRT